MPEHGRMLLIAPEYAWKYLNKVLTMLTMLGFSICRDIVTRTLLLLQLMLLCSNSCLFSLYNPGTLLRFQVFKWSVGCIFKCETTIMKLAKKKRRIFMQKLFLHNVIFYQILILFKFLKVSYVLPDKVSGGHKCYIFSLF